MIEAERLDREDEIKKVDRSSMLEVVGKMPEMIEEAVRLSSAVRLPKPKKVSQVIVAGMGGSAIAGDIAADIFLKKAKVPILVNRSYTLPGFAGPETLTFALSYSGNTEETLSATKEARNKVCVTSGGKLKEAAENKKCPLFLIPAGYQPRAALPYLLVPLLLSMQRLGLVLPVSEEIAEAIALLRKLREEYGPGKPARSNPAKQMAKRLMGKIPVIFGTTGATGAAALRFKTQFSENSKVTALVNVFPELNHNEIVNLSEIKREKNPFLLMILRDEKENERLKKGIEIVKSLIGRQLGGVSEVVSQGRSKLARILSLVLFGDYVSVYLAIQNGVDPTPVEVISRLKKEMLR